MVDNSQEYRLNYWATRSSVRSFVRSLTSLTPSLVGQRMMRLLFCLSFFLLSTIVRRLFLPHSAHRGLTREIFRGR